MCIAFTTKRKQRKYQTLCQTKHKKQGAILILPYKAKKTLKRYIIFKYHRLDNKILISHNDFSSSRRDIITKCMEITNNRD